MYSYNPYYEKYLAHYGVLGMKWGVRKAKRYATDLNAYNYRKQKHSLKKQYHRGDISQEQYKKAKASAKENFRSQTARDYNKIENEALAGKNNPSKKASEIYSKYKQKAYKEIPGYLAKKGIRIGTAVAAGIVGGYAGAAANRILKTSKALKAATAANTAARYDWWLSVPVLGGKTLTRTISGISNEGVTRATLSMLGFSGKYYGKKAIAATVPGIAAASILEKESYKDKYHKK